MNWRTEDSNLPNLLRQHWKFYYKYLFFNFLRRFKFRNSRYRYFTHLYNTTWVNERSVEIPIALGWLKKQKGRGLEIGNVISHYHPISHIVLDKYEKADNVVNKDFISYRPRKKFDYVVSISTIEHIGRDEKRKDPKKVFRAIKAIRSMITKGGSALITFPCGYHLELDKEVKSGKKVFDETYYMQRVSESNAWKQVDRKDILKSKYNEPYPWGNVVVIGIINNVD